MSDPVPTYQWRCAPANLRTKRQLAAVGKRPNGQDIAGFLPPHRGKVAQLFDVNLAAPKRPATDANWVALAKANRERQLRAAERHGFDRAEFEQEGDPGPGWDTPAPAPAPAAAAAPRAVNAFAAAAQREQHEREQGWER